MKPITTLKVNGEVVPVREDNKYSIHWKDILKGILIAAGTPVADFLIQAFNDVIIHGGSFAELDWRRVAGIAIAAFFTYILKNFFTTSNVVIEKSDIPKK